MDFGEWVVRGIALLLVVILMSLVVSCEVGVWNECRAEHSVVYCWRVLG